MKLLARSRRFLWVSLLTLGLVSLVGSMGLWAQDSDGPHAARLSVDGGIGPATTDYLVRSMENARDQGARVIVIQMNTPGGLDAATRDIIQAILQSPIPVMTYVHPAGSRAASAGTYILYGSHIAAMTPSTNLGAATPVQMGGSLSLDTEEDGDSLANGEVAEDPAADEAESGEAADDSSAMERKVINDSVAYIRGLAERHGRNADWAEEAVREAVSLTASEALGINVIDIVVDDMEDLLAQAHGRTVQMEHTTQILDTEDLSVVDYDPDWRNEVLALLTSPEIAYILLLIGIYGLILEGYNPGALVPGVVGAISLLLALYALQMLPLNYAGLALIVLGALLIVAEAFAPSFGVLGLGGVAAIVLGSIMLIDTDVPGFEVPIGLIATIGALSSVVALYITVSVTRSLRMAKVAADQAMVGMTGDVRNAGSGGVQVMLNGELWQAQSEQSLEEGQRIVVKAQRGLKLDVEPAGEANNEED